MGLYPDDKNRTRKTISNKNKKGQKTPFNLGFTISEYSKNLAQKWQIQVQEKGPIVTQVIPNSPASIVGLAPGDVILDVNRKRTRKVKDIMRYLTKKQNVLRVFRNQQILIFLLKNSII